MADVGGRTLVSLEVPIGLDTFFDILWFQDKAETEPELISEASGAIRASNLEDMPVILNLTPFLIVDVGMVQVRITALATAELPPMNDLVWDLMITGGIENDKRIALGGRCEIVQRAT